MGGVPTVYDVKILIIFPLFFVIHGINDWIIWRNDFVCKLICFWYSSQERSLTDLYVIGNVTEWIKMSIFPESKKFLMLILVALNYISQLDMYEF